MRPLALVGRILYALIFLTSGLLHFSQATIAFAVKTGVPAANALVPISGVVAVAGALMILFGFYARIGAALLIVFLVPVTLAMHQFWAVTEPIARQAQFANFMKNVALLGAAVYMCYFGSGPLSVDAWLTGRARTRRAPQRPVMGTPTTA